MNEVKTKTGEAIEGLLEKNGLSIRAFAIRMETTYEFIRRVVRGESLPGKPMLKMMAEALGVDPKPLLRNLVADQISKKYGSIPLEISNKKPGMASIEGNWDKLTSEQQKELTERAFQMCHGVLKDV